MKEVVDKRKFKKPWWGPFIGSPGGGSALRAGPAREEGATDLALA